MSFGRLRFTTQLTILVITATLISLSLVVTVLLSQAQVIVEDAIVARGERLLETTARQLASPVWRKNKIDTYAVIAPMPRADSIHRVALYDEHAAFVIHAGVDEQTASTGGDEQLVRTAIRENRNVQRRGADSITLVGPIQGPVRPIGAVAMSMSTDDIRRQLSALRSVALLVGLALSGAMALVAWGIARYTVSPIHALMRAAAAFGRGDLTAPVDVQRGGELGMLAQEFRRMAQDLLASRQRVEEQNQVLEQHVAERTATLQQALDELREAVAVRESLAATVRELSSPVVPVLEGILVMPLIGVIDSARASVLVSSMLHAIEQHRAVYVIIDVTGVPIVDTQVARVLLEAAAAARFLGTSAILSGLRPELAQTIVGLGLDLSQLQTRADLRSALTYAMGQGRNARTTVG